ncbi:MAG: M15 family metallopeptidase [Sandaracinaceae bacterium]
MHDERGERRGAARGRGLQLSSGPPPDFVDLRSIVGLRFAIGYASHDNFTGAPLPGYETGAAWLHRAAAEALARAAEALRSRRLTFVVYDAYRPLRATRAMVDYCEREGQEWLLDGWVGRTSRHNRGVAIDVGLAHLASGEPLDMGSAWDAFDPSSYVVNATGAARAARRELAQAMTTVGFVPYEKEWWHFELRLDPMPEPCDIPYG